MVFLRRAVLLAVLATGVVGLVLPGSVAAAAKQPGPPSGSPVRLDVRPPAATHPVRRLDPVKSATDVAVTIFSDDFESDLSDWTLDNVGGTAASWGLWTCWSGDTPLHSAGCAAGGTSPISCGANYPDGMDTRLIYGPFSLADPGYTAAELDFNFQLNSEQGYDYFSAYASIGGPFYGLSWSGVETPQAMVLDLTAVPTTTEPLNCLGQSQVWIMFRFTSDSSISDPNGAQVDDVVIRATSSTANQVPQITLTAPNGGESWQAGTVHTISWSATDADGPQQLGIGLDYSTDGGSSWTVIASDLPNSGSYAWSVPSVASTTARVRARAFDGVDESSDTSDANFTIFQSTPANNTLALGSATGMAGTSVVVGLELTNDSAVKGVQADLTYDPAVVAFEGLAATGRGADFTAAGEITGSGTARVVLYYDDATTLAAGDGAIANVVFELVGAAAAQTTVDVTDIVLSDPDGLPLACDGASGTITATATGAPPGLQIAALRNPGRDHTLQIIVAVSAGSGNPPTVEADGSEVAMTPLGGGRYLGTYFGPMDATSVTITAVDVNANGEGSDQVIIAYQ